MQFEVMLKTSDKFYSRSKQQEKRVPVFKHANYKSNKECLCAHFFQLDRFIPISKLKYYFAVDTVYVGKKLGLLIFPYMHEVRLFISATSYKI